MTPLAAVNWTQLPLESLAMTSVTLVYVVVLGGGDNVAAHVHALDRAVNVSRRGGEEIINLIDAPSDNAAVPEAR